MDRKSKLDNLQKKRQKKSDKVILDLDDPKNYGEDGELLPCYRDDFIEDDLGVAVEDNGAILVVDSQSQEEQTNSAQDITSSQEDNSMDYEETCIAAYLLCLS